MITSLDYKPSPRRLSVCLSQRAQQTIAVQSVTPKYHHWVSCFYFLFKWWKVLNLLCFFSTQIDHLNGLQTIVKLWTCCLWETVISKRIRDSQHILNIEFPALAQLSTIPHKLNEAAELNPISKNESHSALWHNLAQFNSIWHPVHYWAQYGLVWHIIKAAYFNPITKTSPLVQFEKIQLN